MEAWLERCAARGLTLVAGIAERDGGALYNSAVVVTPGGFVGTYRKLHLWDQENRWFAPGDRGVPVFDTPVGRIATIICYDGWFPECYRLAALDGADLVCVPTNWVPIPGQGRVNRRWRRSVPGRRALELDRRRRGRQDRGRARTAVHRAERDRLAHRVAARRPGERGREELLVADVDPAEARRARRWNEFNDPLADRRPEVYGRMAGS